jgi:HSP20 family protein
MYDTDESVVLKAAIPGIKPEDIDVSITGDTLTIKADPAVRTERRSRSGL